MQRLNCLAVSNSFLLFAVEHITKGEGNKVYNKITLSLLLFHLRKPLNGRRSVMGVGRVSQCILEIQVNCDGCKRSITVDYSVL